MSELWNKMVRAPNRKASFRSSSIDFIAAKPCTLSAGGLE